MFALAPPAVCVIVWVPTPPSSVGILLLSLACVLPSRHVCISVSCYVYQSAFRCFPCPLILCCFFLPASCCTGMSALMPPAVCGRLRSDGCHVRWHLASSICLRPASRNLCLVVCALLFPLYVCILLLFPACVLLSRHVCISVSCCVWSPMLRCLPLSVGIFQLLFAYVLLPRQVCISISCCKQSPTFRCLHCPLAFCWFCLPASYCPGMFALASPAACGRPRFDASLVRLHPGTLICLRPAVTACLRQRLPLCVVVCVPMPPLSAFCFIYLPSSCRPGMFALAPPTP
jgi:hypothetical protein